MIKDRVTAEEIEAAIANRISGGVYRPGGSIPPLREIAQELGANRNTVNKACRALQAAGILELRAGKKGFFVRRSPAGEGGARRFRKQARELVWQAMAAGVPRDQVLGDLTAIVEQVYGSGEIRVKFYECNLHDSETLGAELARLVGMPLDTGLLDELDTAAEPVAQRYDLIVTTFHHLAAVNRTLVHHLEKIVGVDTRPTPDALLGIARLHSPRVGLVCTLGNTAHMLKHVIYSYHPDCTVEVALIDHSHEVERLVRWCDHLIVTHTCVEALQAITDRAPDVLVEFRIDEQSVAYLRERIHEARQHKAAPGLPALSGQPGLELV
ncbi:MAG TPA: GntR family transcriptional regulator [Roseiflexaceae bacterium]|nr:GntR family transcriptional regulator [Roseiflexaceae bacterium]